MSVYAHLSQTPAHPSARIQPVMILAGGTGGHIFPGLAVAKVLSARGVPVTWLGADGAMETRLVPQHDIPIDTLAITGLRGKGMVKLLGAPLRVMRAVRAAGFVLRKRQPRAVISFGGFAAGPGGLAARLLGAPLLVHEQNRAPGMTNKVLSRFARRVLTGFPGSFAGEEAVGNPVRAEIAALPAPADRLVGRTGPVCVLVLGGSQGARVLNQAVPTALAALGHPDVEVRHQCGEKLRAEARWRMHRPASTPASNPLSPTWLRPMRGPIWWCAVPGLPRLQSCAPPVSAACWCRLPPPWTTIKPAMPNIWLGPTPPCCSSRTTAWQCACSRCCRRCSPTGPSPVDGQRRTHPGQAGRRRAHRRHHSSGGRDWGSPASGCRRASGIRDW